MLAAVVLPFTRNSPIPFAKPVLIMSIATEESVEALRKQMQAVRRELHYDVEGVVDTAKELTDWKHYMRSYPWACLGAALAVVIGYLPSIGLGIAPGFVLLAGLVAIALWVRFVGRPVEE